MKTVYEKILASVKRDYSWMTEEEQKRVANSYFARFITRGQTIGRVNGKLVIGKPN